MYQVTIGHETTEHKDLDDLRRSFGVKSEYTTDTNGEILINHPLNPRVTIRAVLVKEGA